ncbi:hypothetical protein [Aliiroseovarius marinus]|uniref:hypothetical protein n=1 Tax=Aliiroseovarius marinus TaxID=2500159 RepID=UPI003D7D6CA5
MESTSNIPHAAADTLAQAFSGDSDIDLLAQSTSPQLAALLLRRLPGVELKVGLKVNSEHFVSQAIGLENAKQLAEYLAGGTIYVPKRHPGYQASLRDQIPKLIAAGLSRPEIAASLSVSQRHVRRIASKLGLSGVSRVKLGPKPHPSPSRSDFNGGLTGVSAGFAGNTLFEACFIPQRAILSKYGIFSPQP